MCWSWKSGKLKELGRGGGGGGVKDGVTESFLCLIIMDELQAKIKADKDAKKKRLEELKAAKLAREGGKKRDDDFGPTRTSDPTFEPNSGKSADIPERLSDPPFPRDPIFQEPRPTLTSFTQSVSCQAQPRTKKVEQEIQVEFDPPAPPQHHSPAAGGVPMEVDQEIKVPSQANLPSVAQVKDPGEAFKKPEVKAPNFEQVVEMPEFTEFFRKSMKLVEWALDQEFDVCESFHGHDIGATLDTHSRLKLVSTIKDDLGDHRCIGSLQFSPAHQDVFLASYTLAGGDTGQHPRGVVKIWNLAGLDKPLHTLICQSSVTAATFAEAESNLILGGLYSGQLVVWDLRAKSAPVQRTPLVPEAHNQPISSITLYTTMQGVHQVASMSSEGKICVWSPNMLHKPLYVSEAKYGSKETACTSMTVPSPDTEVFHVGMEDGMILEACLKPNKGEEVEEVVIPAHTGPVTALDMHNSAETEGFAEGAGGLLLSASVDWTVKLWHPASRSVPLLTFENYEDYVYAVKWSPSHPATFAVGDGDGHLDVWDILNSTENPFIRHKVGEGAVNQVAWSLHGARLAAGTSRGEISIFQLEQDQGKVSDWLHLEQMFSLGNTSQRYSVHLLKLAIRPFELHADGHPP